jgi:hypothetical protein
MNYDNITKENFNDYLDDFNNSLSNISFFLLENENEDNNEVNFEVDYEDIDPEIIELYELKKKGLSFKDDLKTAFNLFDIRFKKLFKFSHENNIYFSFCSHKVYENRFQDRFKDFENKFIDVQKIEFVKKEVETILNSFLLRFNMFSVENQTILKNAKIKKTEFLQSISKDFNFNIIKRDESDFLNFNEYKVEVKTEPKENTTPKHENIFCNNGFVLFDYILNEYVKTNIGRLSDIHFFYRSMYDNKPQFIHQRPERFKEWFFENYNEDLGKIKTYNEVKNPDRQIHYSNALNWFKLQNK